MAKQKIRVKGLPEVLKKLDNMGGSASRVFAQFLEKSGFDFLDVVQNQIISMQVVDTRLMLNSFQSKGKGNVWQIKKGGLVLEVGTNVEYARYVNDGHWTTPTGVAQRWVPGYWNGSKFTHDPTAKSGMLLKRKFIPGRPYWDNAVTIYEKMFGKDFQKLLSNWLDKEWG